MIEKVITLKSIGRFRNCNPIGDTSLRKLTLIFAENGRGKTTLCAILRSLQTGIKEYILERKTLGSNEPILVQMLIDGNIFKFQNNAWTGCNPNVAIFDSAFIHDNIYAGDYIDHQHKNNLYHVIIGSQGVQLAKKIAELDSKIREINADINTKKESASKTLPAGIALEDYIKWKPVADIDNRIQQKSIEIASRQRTLEKAADILAKGVLAKITLPIFPSNFQQILAKQISDITADAETRVRAQIDVHNMEHLGESWISQGVGFIAGDKCPFCGQLINGNDLISAYRSHFNAAYKELKQEVEQLSVCISDSIGENALAVTHKSLAENLVLLEFWKQFAEISLPELSADDVRIKYSALLKMSLVLAHGKQQKPTEPISPDVEFQTAYGEVKTFEQLLHDYNAAVDTCNSRINGQKAAARQGADVNAMKKELAELEANKNRFMTEVAKACEDYLVTLKTKAEFEEQKATAKDQLNQYCSKIIRTYEQTINVYLDQFNAGFRITNSKHLYTGGTPSSYYQIQINSRDIDLGDSRTLPGTPCFKTTLSSGDRSALALAFFLAALKQDVEIGNKIVVLDDPFTSQDRFRRTCTQQLIRNLSTKAKQVIVLSHDPHFLKLILDGYPPADIKVLQMCRTGDNTRIGECDIESETQSTYLRNYSTLLDFYREDKGETLAVARSIRPFIEGMLRAHFPGRFVSNEWLGDFIAKIRFADDADGLSHEKADLPEIEAINDYSKKYHHEQNNNADSEPLTSDELRGFVKRTLKLVGGA